MTWYLEVLRKYAVFDGRARRKEFWMFTLVHLLVSVALSIAGISAAMNHSDSVSKLALAYALVVLLPGLGVSVRRMHDTGRSGWWVLIALVPFVGAIVFIVLAATDGEPGSNEYGDNPKDAFA